MRCVMQHRVMIRYWTKYGVLDVAVLNFPHLTMDLDVRYVVQDRSRCMEPQPCSVVPCVQK